MSTHTIKQNSDINVWGAVLGDALSRLRLVSDIKIVANGNNPPTVQAGTNFQVYGTDTFTSSPATPTLNNVYPANTSLTYYLDSVIFELADQTFAWNTAAGATSAGIPAKSNSTTYYLFCNGGQDVDSTSRGKGKYGVSTNAPTYDVVKKGWYSSDGLVVASFETDGSGNVSLLGTYSFESVSKFEIFTGKYWYDGRPVYRKLINFGALPNATSKSVAHGISGITVANSIIWLESSYATDGTNPITLPYSLHGNFVGLDITFFSSTNITIYASSNQSSYSTCYLVINYVK